MKLLFLSFFIVFYSCTNKNLARDLEGQGLTSEYFIKSARAGKKANKCSVCKGGGCVGCLEHWVMTGENVFIDPDCNWWGGPETGNMPCGKPSNPSPSPSPDPTDDEGSPATEDDSVETDDETSETEDDGIETDEESDINDPSPPNFSQRPPCFEAANLAFEECMSSNAAIKDFPDPKERALECKEFAIDIVYIPCTLYPWPK